MKAKATFIINKKRTTSSKLASEYARVLCSNQKPFFLQQNDICSNKVKEENLKLKSENGVLGQYIENLMQV